MPTEAVLQLLENGQWHYIKDLSKLTSLANTSVDHITEFLAKYNFVKIDQTTQRIKLDTSTAAFLKKVRQLETEEKLQKF
ncbi:MAG: hypothetical protein OQK81_04615 [Candidatus Bathyarchaeota archaeon]|nr:hypothetical protein [Candidatus Bathyarchaeota archaeon]